MASATWSADGRHVLFSRHDSSHVESVPVTGGIPSRVFSAPRGLRVHNVGVQLRDGSMVLSLARRGPSRLAGALRSQMALWQVRPQAAATGSPDESPRQVTEWRDGDVSAVSASSDGKRVDLSALLQADVYIASFDQRGRRLRDTPRRMTLDERDDRPCAWTLDGQAVIFSSDRYGSSDVFMQNVDGISWGPRCRRWPRRRGALCGDTGAPRPSGHARASAPTSAVPCRDAVTATAVSAPQRRPCYLGARPGAWQARRNHANSFCERRRPFARRKPVGRDHRRWWSA